jgi:hypothetical protein
MPIRLIDLKSATIWDTHQSERSQAVRSCVRPPSGHSRSPNDSTRSKSAAALVPDLVYA